VATLLFFVVGSLTNMVVIKAAMLVPIAAGCLFLFFFRDPERRTPDRGDQIVAPADGRVVFAGCDTRSQWHEGVCQRVDTFLSLWNVHVNRIPVSGQVAWIKEKQGRFIPAFRSGASEKNAQIVVGIQTRIGLVVVRQIAGLVARGVVCRVRQGDTVVRGQRYGLIKLGSRVELFLPPSVKLLIQRGSSVRSGESVIGLIQNEA